MRRAGMRRDAVATKWSTSAILNRSAKPSGLFRLRCNGAQVHCSRTNLSGSPTQRRRALPVGAVGIAAKTAVGGIGPIRIGPVGVGAVGVGAVGVGAVGVGAVGVGAVGVITT